MSITTKTSGTDAADAMSLPAFITSPSRRKRKAFRRGRMDHAPTITTLPGGAVSVSLYGSRAAGRAMILDADVWADVRDRLSERWTLNTNGRGRTYVRSGQRRAAAIAGQPGAKATASLGRIVAQAGRGDVVRYRDGNPLNLRRANLDVLAGADAQRFRREHAGV